MTPGKNIQDREDPDGSGLTACALTVARRYQAGALPLSPHVGWTSAWRALIRDLRSDCPGFSEIEYGIALNQAFARPNGDTAE